MIEQEFEFYQKNKAALISKYPDQYIVIKNAHVIGSYSSRVEALEATQKDHKLGTFLIQHASLTEEPIQRFHSRVAF
jgi:hypothetical protein